eukprot:scaffold8250_cov194-Isochrysis_galbana.AAC.4
MSTRFQHNLDPISIHPPGLPGTNSAPPPQNTRNSAALSQATMRSCPSLSSVALSPPTSPKHSSRRSRHGASGCRACPAWASPALPPYPCSSAQERRCGPLHVQSLGPAGFGRQWRRRWQGWCAILGRAGWAEAVAGRHGPGPAQLVHQNEGPGAAPRAKAKELGWQLQ